MVRAGRDLVRAAALVGHGIALLPLPLIHEDVAAGRLVPVLTAQIGAEARLSAVYAEREFLPAAVRAFVEATVRWAAGLPLFNRGELNLERPAGRRLRA